MYPSSVEVVLSDDILRRIFEENALISEVEARTSVVYSGSCSVLLGRKESFPPLTLALLPKF